MSIDEIRGRWESVVKRETWARDVMRKYADRDIPFLLDEYASLTAQIEALKSDLINANMNLEIMTHRAEAFENAAREFECTTGVFSFACFCCTYKIEADAHKCGLLDDEVCEDLENWECGQALEW